MKLKLIITLFLLSLSSYLFSMDLSGFEFDFNDPESKGGSFRNQISSYINSLQTRATNAINSLQIRAANAKNSMHSRALEAKDSLLEKIGDNIGQVGASAVKSFAQNQITQNEAAAMQDQLQKQSEEILDKTYATIRKGSILAIGSAAAIFSIWYTYKYVWNRIEHVLKVPAIPLQESSPTIWTRLKNFISKSKAVELQPLYFNADLTSRLKTIVHIAGDTAQRITDGDKYATFNNILLWGKPGTGKTVFAKQLIEELAKERTIDYIYLDGVFFAPSQGNTLKKVDALFNKIQGNRKPVVLFIDHAEFLFAKKECDLVAESYQIMSRFLHYAKQCNNKCMIIFATRPMPLSEDMHEIIHESIEFGLPEEPERYNILKYNRDHLFTNNKNNSKKLIEDARKTLSDETLKTLAHDLKDCSCKDLEEIMRKIKNFSLTRDCTISYDMIKLAIDQIKQKNRYFKQSLS